MNNILNKYIAINISISVVILFIVYVLQYFFGMAPCDMCINERYPYFIVIILGIVSYGIKSNTKVVEIVTNLIFAIIYFIGLIYSVYHVGIERKYWIGSSNCSSKINTLDIETLSSQLMEMPIIRCDEPTFLFNFISIAELNTIAMGVLLIFSLIVLYKKI